MLPASDESPGGLPAMSVVEWAPEGRNFKSTHHAKDHRAFCDFRISRISVSSTSSFVGAAGGGGAASFLRINVFISLITMKIDAAMMMKLMQLLMNVP